MSEVRSEQLRRLLDEHAWRPRRIEWLKQVSTATGREYAEVDLLPHEAAEEVRRDFFERVKSGSADWRSEYSPDDADRVLSLLTELSGRLCITEAFLVAELGVVSVDPSRILESAKSLYRPRSEDLALTTAGAVDGLLVGSNIVHESGPDHDRWYHDVIAWGGFAPSAAEIHWSPRTIT